MAFDQGSYSKPFATRYVYNSDFVHNCLFDNNNISKLKSMGRYVKPNVLYSDVLKKAQPAEVSKQSSNGIVQCFGKNSDCGKIAKGKNAKLYGFNIETPGKVFNREALKDQCVSHVCRDMNNNVNNELKQEIKVD